MYAPVACGLSSVYVCVHSPWAASCSGPRLGSGSAFGGVLGLCPPPGSFTQGPLRPGHSLQPVSLGGEGRPRPHRSGRPGCPRRRRWTLPSTSGGHDPISAARGRDRCFLPGQTSDWGAVCKGWGGGRPNIRGAPGQGEPRTRPAARAVASAAQRSRGPPHPVALTLAGRAGPSRRGQWGPPAGRTQGTGRADSGPEPGRRLGGCRQRTRQGSPFHIHTTRAHAKPPFPLSGPTAVLPLPRSRRYLWGSRLVAASRAGVPLPLLLLLRRWLRLGAGPCGGAGPPRRGWAQPGSSLRREVQRAGTGWVGKVGAQWEHPNGAWPSPALLLGLQPQLRNAE